MRAYIKTKKSTRSSGTFRHDEKENGMVDLKAKPYHLNEEDIQWVRDTIRGMSDEEKVGQLFFQLTAGIDEDYLKELMDKYHLGGCRFNKMPGIAVQSQNRILQKHAKIPVFIACNTENGGGGGYHRSPKIKRSQYACRSSDSESGRSRRPLPESVLHAGVSTAGAAYPCFENRGGCGGVPLRAVPARSGYGIDSVRG